MTEPVSLEDIKRHLVLDQDDTGEDAYLASLITAARHVCEMRTGRAIVGKDAMVVLSGFPSGPGRQLAVWLDGSLDVALERGTVSAFEIRYYDADGTDRVLDGALVHGSLTTVPALIRPLDVWPQAANRPDAVRISYTISPLVPDLLQVAKQAIRLIVGHWYANREAVTVEGRAAPAELPLAVTWLLEPLRIFASR